MTGEVLDLATPKPEFHITNAEEAEWVFGKLCDSESEEARLKMVLASVKERLESDIKAEKRKQEYLRWKYGNELAEFAKNNLPQGKRTYKGIFGEVAFRSTAERIDVVDDGLAIDWAEANSPNAVKVSKHLNKSEIVEEQLTALKSNSEWAKAHGFEVVPAGESVTIKTVKA